MCRFRKDAQQLRRRGKGRVSLCLVTMKLSKNAPAGECLGTSPSDFILRGWLIAAYDCGARRACKWMRLEVENKVLSFVNAGGARPTRPPERMKMAPGSPDVC